MDKEKDQLPRKCRFRPDDDMFREQEEHKIHFGINEWCCGLIDLSLVLYCSSVAVTTCDIWFNLLLN